MDKLMRREEVAEFLNIDLRTVDRYKAEGIITPCKMPAVRYNRQEIEKLARVEQTPYSPLERRRAKKEMEEMQKQINDLQQEVKKYKDIFAQLNLYVSKINYEQLQQQSII